MHICTYCGSDCTEYRFYNSGSDMCLTCHKAFDAGRLYERERVQGDNPPPATLTGKLVDDSQPTVIVSQADSGQVRLRIELPEHIEPENVQVVALGNPCHVVSEVLWVEMKRSIQHLQAERTRLLADSLTGGKEVLANLREEKAVLRERLYAVKDALRDNIARNRELRQELHDVRGDIETLRNADNGAADAWRTAWRECNERSTAQPMKLPPDAIADRNLAWAAGSTWSYEAWWQEQQRLHNKGWYTVGEHDPQVERQGGYNAAVQQQPSYAELKLERDRLTGQLAVMQVEVDGAKTRAQILLEYYRRACRARSELLEKNTALTAERESLLSKIEQMGEQLSAANMRITDLETEITANNALTHVQSDVITSQMAIIAIFRQFYTVSEGL